MKKIMQLEEWPLKKIMISEQQKNNIILNRFETAEKGTKIIAYKVTVDGKQFPVICMNGETLEQATKSCESIFGKRLESVTR